MRLAKPLVLASSLISLGAVTASAEVKVVASIKPVHSLVAAVMEGVGIPGLIIEGAGSPHTYSMKPSQAKMLEEADAVFWIGHELEAFLAKPLETIASDAVSVELIDAHGLVKLAFREGGAFEEHSHEGEDAHDDHAHDKKPAGEQAGKKAHDHDHDHGHDHAHEKKAEAKADHDHDHDHAHGAFDAHVWLDPQNARAMVHEIEEALSKIDPGNAGRYEANAEAVMARLDALTDELVGELAPVRGKGFVVFHDAYQYFENRFGLSASGSITVSPEVMPGAERIGEIRERVRELGAACVFAEPQFEPKLVSTVIEGTQARSGVIDPLGSSLENGPDLYFSMIRDMAKSIRTCLNEAS